MAKFRYIWRFFTTLWPFKSLHLWEINLLIFEAAFGEVFRSRVGIYQNVKVKNTFFIQAKIFENLWKSEMLRNRWKINSLGPRAWKNIIWSIPEARKITITHKIENFEKYKFDEKLTSPGAGATKMINFSLLAQRVPCRAGWRGDMGVTRRAVARRVT